MKTIFAFTLLLSGSVYAMQNASNNSKQLPPHLFHDTVTKASAQYCMRDYTAEENKVINQRLQQEQIALMRAMVPDLHISDEQALKAYHDVYVPGMTKACVDAFKNGNQCPIQ